jgi:hypothetical protein
VCRVLLVARKALWYQCFNCSHTISSSKSLPYKSGLYTLKGDIASELHSGKVVPGLHHRDSYLFPKSLRTYTRSIP